MGAMAWIATSGAEPQGSARRAALLAGTGLASLLATGLSIAPRPAAAQLPTGGSVVGGSGTIAQTASNQLTITQTTSSMAANWNSFSIGAGNVVQFVQPSSSAIALNRVVGPEPSVIAGRLEANGRLVLVNPNGLLFSQGSQVNVASLVATTANIPTTEFMAGRLAFSEPGKPGSSVVNEGTITVAQGGLAALVAPTVRNSGTIRAQLGRVVLAGAESFTLDPRGDGLISFEVARGGPVRETRAENAGRIQADGGTVQITAASARGIVSGVVNVGGEVSARTVGMQNGVVVFGSGEAGTTTVSGTVDVSGTQAGQTGGRATITGDRVRVTGTARIDARGAAGGGTVLVGGNIQGRGPEQNARQTAVDAGAVIRADATQAGRGGTVVVWSDQYTSFMGAISARGGEAGGDGGFVEVSGKLWLGFNGTVDTRAPLGRAGTLLLDPTDITISTGANNDITTTTPFEFVDNTAPPSLSGTSNLNVTTLETALAAGNVVVSTTAGTGAPAGGTITVANAVSWTTTNSLTLNATNGIAINAAITATANGNQNGALSGALVLSTAAGGITQSSAGVIRAASVSATAATGSVVLGNTNNRIGDVSGTAGGAGATFGVVSSEALSAGAITTGSAGRVDLRAGEGTALTLNGAIDAGGGTAVFVADTLTLGAGGALGGAGASRVELRTATAGRVIQAGAGAAGAGLALPTATLAALAPTTGGTLRIGSAGTVAGEAGSGVVTLTGLSTGALVVESASNAGAGAIVQTGTITAPSLQAIAPDGPVVLTNAGNAVLDGTPQGGTVSGQANAFSFTNNSSFKVGRIDVGAGTVTLRSETGTIGHATGAGTGITAGTLIANAPGLVGGAGAVLLTNPLNDVAVVQGQAGSNFFQYTDANAVTASSITAAGPVTITSAGGTVTAGAGISGSALSLVGQTGVAQSAAITVGSVVATSAAGNVTLENAGNTITTVSGSVGANRSFSVRDSDALAVGAVSVGNNGSMRFEAGAGSTLAINGTLAAPGAGSSAVFIADAISATAGFGADRAASTVIRPVTAGTAINLGTGAAGGLAISQATADFLAPAIGGTYRIGSLGTGGEAAAGQITITGLDVDQRTLELRTTSALANAITQTGGLSAQALVATAPNGGVRLLDPDSNNQVGSFSATASAFGVSHTNAVGFQIDGISTTGDVSLRARTQGITQGSGAGAAIGGGAQTVTAVADAGGVTLTNSANSANDVSGSAGGGSFAYTDANALTLLNVSATGNTTIIAGGDLTLPDFTAIAAGASQRLQLQSGGTLDLGFGVQFTVNNGTAVFAADSITGGTGSSFFTGAITASEIRTGTAGRGIALGSGDPGTQLVLDNTVLGSLAPLGGAGTLRVGATGQVAGEVASGAVQVNGASLGSTTLVLETGASGAGAISQTDAITAANLAALAPNGGVALNNTLNNVSGSVAGQAGAGGFAFTNAGNINVGTVAGTVGINATGNVALTVTGFIGNITQSAPITGATLTVNANGFGSTVTLNNAGNAVTTVAGQSTGSFSFVDSDGLNTGAITTFSGGVTLTAGGALGINGTLNTPGTATLSGTTITQSAPILANSLVATGSASDVVLTNVGNSVNSVSGQALGAFNFTNDGTVSVAGIDAGTIALTSLNGNITQTGAIASTGTLTANTGSGSVTLTNAGNANTGIAGSAGGNFSYTDLDGFAVNGVTATGGTLTLIATTGAITQGAGAGNRINAFGVSATATGAGGAVTLDNAANTASVVSGSTVGDFTYRDADGLATGVISSTGGTVALTAGGTLAINGALNAAGQTVTLQAAAITQAAPITADSVVATASAGSVSLANAGNAVGTVSGSGTTGFTFTDSDGLITGAISGSGPFVLTAGGLLDVTGPLNAGNQSVSLAGASITQTGAISANGVTATTSAGTLTAGPITSTGAVSLTAATTLAVTSAIDAAGQASLNAASIVQTGAISANGVTATATGGALATGPITSTGAVALTAATGLSIDGALNAAGQAVTLTALNGGVTQSAPITSAGVTANASNGAVDLQNPANAAGSISGSGAGFAFRDSGALDTGAITSTVGPVTLTAAGALGIGGALNAAGQAITLSGTSVGQSAAITGQSLIATATAGGVALTSTGNTVGSVGGGATGAFAYTGGNGFAVSGIASGGAVTLAATTGAITQTGGITGASLIANANGAGGAVALTDAGNDVASVSGSAAGNFAYADATAVAVGGISAGNTVTLTAQASDLTQTGAITAAALTANAGGAVTLTGPGNSVASVGGGAGGNFAYTNSTALSISGIAAGGNVTLEAGTGGISQTGAITTGPAGTLSVTASNGAVALTLAGNDADTITGSAGTGFQYRDASNLNVGAVTTTTGDISLAAGGNLALQGNVTAATVRLQAGGSLSQAGGSGIVAQDLLAIAGGTVDLFSATNRVGTFAGGGDVVNFRNSESLIVGAVDGDATVNGGATQFGVIANTAARITVGQAPGSPALLNLTIEQPVAAERMQLTIATGAGLLRVNPNRLQGAGGAGTPSVVVLDVTGRQVPNSPDLVALPTFSGVGDRPPNVPIPIVLGPNQNADIDLTSQNIAGTSLYLLMNGGQAINSGGSLNVRGLALYPGTLPTTSVTFTGTTVNGQPGQTAASQGRIAVDPNSRFQINNCPIGTVSCVIQPLTVPGVPSVGEVPLAAPIGARPDEGSISLVNTGNEESEDEETRRIAVGRPAQPQESAR